jgi:hypothetical protein
MESELIGNSIPGISELDFSGFADESEDLELLEDPDVLPTSLRLFSARDLSPETCNGTTSASAQENNPQEDRGAHPENPLTHFRNRYLGYMDLYADAETVAKYLDAHQGWFCRCAHPMQAELIDTNAYALGIGWVGSLGYKIDPRIGLNLLPQDQGAYCIETVPIPGQAYQGYDVDFKAVMTLSEKSGSEAEVAGFPLITSVEWQLDLTVTLQFPKFIHALPQQAIQSTGDTVLAHIVRSVSKRLTSKVQQDFHQSIGVNLPKKSLFSKFPLGKGSDR